MLQRVLIVLFILLIVPDTYIYYVYVRKWTSVWWKRALYFLPSLLLLTYLIIVLAQDDYRAPHQPMVGTLMIVFLLVTTPKMLFTLFDAIGAGSGKLKARLKSDREYTEEEMEKQTQQGKVLWRYMRLFAMALALCSALIILYGYFWGRNRYQVNQQEIYFETLPDSFDGYRILHFSDLHIGTFADGHQDDVSTIVDLINRQNCDMVVFTGDVVNYESAELNGYDQVLSKLHAPDGVYSVMGNHDYDMYLHFQSEKEKMADIEIIKSKEREYGWRLLLNENVVLHRGNDSIALLGSENDGLPPWPALGDIPKMTEGLTGVRQKKNTESDSIATPPEHTFSILLTHDPTHWRRNIIPETNIDLTLAGHTHAGQLKIFGWSPIWKTYSEWSGVYTEGFQVLNVTDGIGNIMIPFRFGAWPELDIITLKKLKQRHSNPEGI